MANKLPKAIVFDWDNTLVEGWSKIQHALNTTFDHYNMPQWDIETLSQKVHKSARDSFPQLFGDDANDALKIFYKAYKESDITPQTLDGAEKTLDMLDNLGIYMAIVSNKNGDLLRSEVSQKSWDKYFIKVIGATDCKEDKPSILPMVEAMKDADFKPEETWFIGDTIVDVQIARNFGCVSVVYGKNRQLGHDIYFANHEQMHDFLTAAQE